MRICYSQEPMNFLHNFIILQRLDLEKLLSGTNLDFSTPLKKKPGSWKYFSHWKSLIFTMICKNFLLSYLKIFLILVP